jgi:hypothetical protein
MRKNNQVNPVFTMIHRIVKTKLLTLFKKLVFKDVVKKVKKTLTSINPNNTEFNFIRNST